MADNPGLQSLDSVVQKLTSLSAIDAARIWDSFSADEWPLLFKLLDEDRDVDGSALNLEIRRAVSSTSSAEDRLTPEQLAVRNLRRNPTLVDGAIAARSYTEAETTAALAEFSEKGCVTIDFFYNSEMRSALSRIISDVLSSYDRSNPCKVYSPSEAPALFSLTEQALRNGPLVELFGGANDRCPRFEIILVVQGCFHVGLEWHRDAFLPRQAEAITAIHDLGNPKTGGVFMRYEESSNKIYYTKRRPGETTLLRNGMPRATRPFHAVTPFNDHLAERRLMICHIIIRD